MVTEQSSLVLLLAVHPAVVTRLLNPIHTGCHRYNVIVYVFFPLTFGTHVAYLFFSFFVSLSTFLPPLLLLLLIRLQALHQLYYDPNIENKNLAQKWLMQAQVSPQAWQFCWALLSPDKVRS